MADEKKHPSLESDDQDYSRIYEKMRTRMLRLFGHQPWLQDVIHNAFETFLHKKHTFRGQGTIESFAERIALNTARNQMRLQKRTALVHDLVRQSPQWPGLTPTPEAETEDRDRIRRLTAVLERLRPGYRIPYLLYHVENRSIREIASVVDATEAAIRKRIARAKSQIHKLARKDPVLAEWLDSMEAEK
jgi:RNA polymerase sigma-70 factor (ECF subfamily)